MDNLFCAGWKQSSCDDGPGIRSVLFLQGCSMQCPGCHNSCTHDKKYGIKKSVDNLFSEINLKCKNKKITISGGEPLEQQAALIVLLKKLKQKNFNVCLYTGWNFSEVPKEFLRYVDFLKCGNFDIRKMDRNLMYVGSSNQKMFKIVAGKVEEINLCCEESA